MGLKRRLVGALAVCLALSVPGTTVRAGPAMPNDGPLPSSQAAQAAGDRPAPADLSPAFSPRPLAAGAVKRGLSREVFGYAELEQLAGPQGTDSWDWSLLSTVAAFGLHVQAGGGIAHDGRYSVFRSATMSHLLQTAHLHGARVLITLESVVDGSVVSPADLCGALHNAATTASQLSAELAAVPALDGVAIDYEGGGTDCGPPPATQDLLTGLAAQVRNAVGGRYLVISTYAGAAPPCQACFFNVQDLNRFADAFFVEAYDLDLSNRPDCGGCLGPTAPLDGYRYNQRRAADEFSAAVGPGKVLMGMPYFGRAACVNDLATPNQVPVRDVVTAAYLVNRDLAGDASVSSFAAHRDQVSSGAERWDTYFSAARGCNRQNYWDDAVSLGAKFDGVNSKDLRGAGIWTLPMAGGAPELWGLVRAKLGSGGPYVPLRPFRVLDTRQSGSRLGPNGMLNLLVAPAQDLSDGANAIPAAGVGAVALNVTVTNATAASYLTLFPAGSARRPVASSLNFAPFQTIANLVEVAVGSGGQVSIYNSEGATDVIVDAVGYYLDGPGPGPAGLLKARSPGRILDTRTGLGGRATPLGPDQSLDLQVAGVGGIDHTAAVALNVTAISGSAGSYLTVYPQGAGSRPLASSLNFPAGANLPNRVLVKLGAGGGVSIYNSEGSVDVAVDLNATFTDVTADGSGAEFHAFSPIRILDTRTGPRLGPDGILALAVAGGLEGPAAQAAAINTTITGATAGSFLTVFPGDLGAPPLASDLNFGPGDTIPNLVIVKVAAGGVRIYNNLGQVDVLADVSGFYTSG